MLSEGSAAGKKWRVNEWEAGNGRGRTRRLRRRTRNTNTHTHTDARGVSQRVQSKTTEVMDDAE